MLVHVPPVASGCDRWCPLKGPDVGYPMQPHRSWRYVYAATKNGGTHGLQHVQSSLDVPHLQWA